MLSMIRLDIVNIAINFIDCSNIFVIFAKCISCNIYMYTFSDPFQCLPV